MIEQQVSAYILPKLWVSERSYAAEFAVNSTAFPHIDDIGESYAGLLPISENQNDTQQLYFWFFPSDNPLAGKEVTVWLNGGVSGPHKMRIMCPM